MVLKHDNRRHRRRSDDVRHGRLRLRLVGRDVTGKEASDDGGTGDHSVTLHQQGEEREEIRDLLERMELNHIPPTHAESTSSNRCSSWTGLVENCGATSGEKHLPEFVFVTPTRAICARPRRH
ncbi:MAG: hypothetical protein U5J64_05975 [Halobacteriales archaeon]|nr:hypothetical protein [Halobacteriales archaeon]